VQPAGWRGGRGCAPQTRVFWGSFFEAQNQNLVAGQSGQADCGVVWGAHPRPPRRPAASRRLRPSYAALPSSSDVMMYVPLLASRSRVTIRCFAASSRSFEKVEYP